jgi:hypothetical protein
LNQRDGDELDALGGVVVDCDGDVKLLADVKVLLAELRGDEGGAGGEAKERGFSR